MSSYKQKIIILILTIFLVLGVYVLNTFLSRFNIQIEGNVAGYYLTYDEKTVFCDQNPCTIKMKEGYHIIRIQKDGYHDYSDNFYAKEDQTLSFLLKKIIQLLPSEESFIPKKTPSRPLPRFLQNTAIQPIWNSDQSWLIYWDSEDERIRRYYVNGKTENITALQNISEYSQWKLSPDETRLFISEGESVYYIDLINKRRKKVIEDFEINHFLWSPDGSQLLANDPENKVYRINWNEESAVTMETELDLKNSLWINDEEVIYYKPEDYFLIFYSFNPNTDLLTPLVTKGYFETGEMIYTPELQTIQIYNKDEGRWYTLLQ